MVHFEYSSLIPAPVSTVFAFHKRPDALETLTPPDQKIDVLRREGGIAKGALVEMRVHLGPITRRWLAVHTAYEENRLFVDEQKEGPFRYWRHEHRFAPEGDGTRLTDALTISLPTGLLADRLFGWIARRQLKKLFAYRHAVTRRETTTPP